MNTSVRARRFIADALRGFPFKGVGVSREKVRFRLVKGHQQKAEDFTSAFLLLPRPRRTLAVRWVDVENRFEFQAVKPSCPLRKALIMLFRGELSEGR